MHKKWTVGIVNYKTSAFMDYQLKILYEFNDPKDFSLIIVDNSEPFEKEFLDGLKQSYAHHGNIEVLYNDNQNENFKLRTSSQHAEGLNLILNRAESDCLLVQDPDFFWIKPRYLHVLEKELNAGALVVGAPYGVAIKTGKPDFPSAFGCAYNLRTVREAGLDFAAGTTEEKEKEHKYPGWKMRAAFSSKPYVAFQQNYSHLPFLFGEHAYLSIPRYYLCNNEVVAYHLFRGAFVSDSKTHVANAHALSPEKYKDNRTLYAMYFYSRIAGKSFNILRYKNPWTLLRNARRLLFTKKIDGSANPYRWKRVLRRLLQGKKGAFALKA